MSKRFATNPKPAATASKRKGPLNKKELAEAAAQQEREDQARWAAEDAAAGGAAPEETSQISVDTAAEVAEAPTQIEPGDTPASGMPPAATPHSSGRKRTASMKSIIATLAPKQRKSKNIVMFNLSDRKNAIQLPRTLFSAEDLATEGFTFELTGKFSDPVVAAPRKRLSKEERAALPKPTLADRVKKAQEKAARLAKKLEAEAAQAASENL